VNIVILGAGQVGSSLARNLANEDNDITIIDTDKNALKELREKLDAYPLWIRFPSRCVRAGKR